MSVPYPFSAIVGQEDLKLALLLNAVSPEVGGVLVRGEKGTAKSTAVRALAKLLPPIKVVAGCPYSCDPASPNPECPAWPHPEDAPVEERPVRLVELPVGASTDRLAGTLDIEKALAEGKKAFEPGLLATAHRGILYVDEVNLLSDHLVDLLLDVAAMGVNHVEREGVSVRHPSRFILVGTMNPEEGELRPQLLDRFGITVEVTGSPDPAERVEVVRRRLHHEADPEDFAKKWFAADGEVAVAVEEARKRLETTRLPEGVLYKIAALCAELGVDGLRGDIVTAKTARALAAWDGREEVVTEDIRRAALLALSHRRRRGPFEQPGIDPEELENALSDGPDPPDGPDGGGAPPPEGGGETEREPQGSDGETSEARPGVGEGNHAATGAVQTGPPGGARERPGGSLGRRSRVVGGLFGQPVGDREAVGSVRDVALAATLRAAAPHQKSRGRSSTGPGISLRLEDLREKVREGREGNLILFVVDASGSMAAKRRMSAVKGAVLSLLADAYQRRDKVGLVSFRGESAQVLLPPTASVELAAPRLEELPTGGRTPWRRASRRRRKFSRERSCATGSAVLCSSSSPTGGPRPDRTRAGRRPACGLWEPRRVGRGGHGGRLREARDGRGDLGLFGRPVPAPGGLAGRFLVQLVERRRVA